MLITFPQISISFHLPQDADPIPLHLINHLGKLTTLKHCRDVTPLNLDTHLVTAISSERRYHSLLHMLSTFHLCIPMIGHIDNTRSYVSVFVLPIAQPPYLEDQDMTLLLSSTQLQFWHGWPKL